MNPWEKKEYLGDGVYAHYDGYQIWLEVERDGRLERVALEPSVFKALFAFASKAWEIKI